MRNGTTRAPSTRNGLAILVLLTSLVLGGVGIVAFYDAAKGERTPAMSCGDLLGPRDCTSPEHEACVDETSEKTPFDAAVPWWIGSGVALISAGVVVAAYPDR